MMIIDHGRLLYDGGVNTLRQRYGRHRTLVVDVQPGEAMVDPALPGVVLTRSEGPRHWLRFDRDAVSAADLISTVAAHAPVRDVTLEEPAIEDIIRQIYEGGLLDEAGQSLWEHRVIA
jgi:ABC-2 type transport system ATP-binding protein